MRRRDLLKTAAAATLTVGAAPRLGGAADRRKTLVFVGVVILISQSTDTALLIGSERMLVNHML